MRRQVRSPMPILQKLLTCSEGTSKNDQQNEQTIDLAHLFLPSPDRKRQKNQSKIKDLFDHLRSVQEHTIHPASFPLNLPFSPNISILCFPARRSKFSFADTTDHIYPEPCVFSDYPPRYSQVREKARKLWQKRLQSPDRPADDRHTPLIPSYKSRRRGTLRKAFHT